MQKCYCFWKASATALLENCENTEDMIWYKVIDLNKSDVCCMFKFVLFDLIFYIAHRILVNLKSKQQ